MVRITGSVAVGALASGDVISGAFTTASVESYRLKSINLSYSWTEIQALIDDGFEFGVAHSDYTAAEIEECLEATEAIDLGDKIAQEKTNRLVRTIGRINSGNLVTAGSGSSQFNDGRLRKTKLNWLMTTGKTLNIWVRNSSGVIWTTGSFVQAIGQMYIQDT